MKIKPCLLLLIFFQYIMFALYKRGEIGSDDLNEALRKKIVAARREISEDCCNVHYCLSFDFLIVTNF